jgi:hypothetical protein
MLKMRVKTLFLCLVYSTSFSALLYYLFVYFYKFCFMTFCNPSCSEEARGPLIVSGPQFGNLWCGSYIMREDCFWGSSVCSWERNDTDLNEIPRTTFSADIGSKLNWNLFRVFGDEACRTDGPTDMTSPLFVHFIHLLHKTQQKRRNEVEYSKK